MSSLSTEFLLKIFYNNNNWNKNELWHTNKPDRQNTVPTWKQNLCTHIYPQTDRHKHRHKCQLTCCYWNANDRFWNSYALDLYRDVCPYEQNSNLKSLLASNQSKKASVIHSHQLTFHCCCSNDASSMMRSSCAYLYPCLCPCPCLFPNAMIYACPMMISPYHDDGYYLTNDVYP